MANLHIAGSTEIDDKNITLNDFIPTTLYSNSSGSNGSITLSQNISNFKYIEVYFKNNDGDVNSIKFKSSSSQTVFSLTSFNANWVKITRCVIEENKLKIESYSERSFNSISTNTGFNHNYITLVLGYKF